METLRKKSLHQLTTMLSMLKTLHFNYRPRWCLGDKSVISTGGYDLEIGHFIEVDSMVVSWWIVFFFCPVRSFMLEEGFP